MCASEQLQDPSGFDADEAGGVPNVLQPWQRQEGFLTPAFRAAPIAGVASIAREDDLAFAAGAPGGFLNHELQSPETMGGMVDASFVVGSDGSTLAVASARTLVEWSGQHLGANGKIPNVDALESCGIILPTVDIEARLILGLVRRLPICAPQTAAHPNDDSITNSAAGSSSLEFARSPARRRDVMGPFAASSHSSRNLQCGRRERHFRLRTGYAAGSRRRRADRMQRGAAKCDANRGKLRVRKVDAVRSIRRSDRDGGVRGLQSECRSHE